jgi:AcrR family transcriptional regulator
MAPHRSPVNPRRRYDATGRQAKARRTRERVIRAANELFLADGYRATSVAAIAAAADVSVDTIYKSFGGKAGLVRAIFHSALRGDDPVPAEERSDLVQATEADPREIIVAWGRFVTELAPRGTPVVLLIRSAAHTDPELSALLQEIDDARLERMRTNARRLHDAGHLRPDVSVDQATDVLWTYSSPELYELLVLRRGMSLARYGAFVADAMTAALLPPDVA